MGAFKIRGFVLDQDFKLVRHKFVYRFDRHGYFKLIDVYDYAKWDKKLKKRHNGHAYHRAFTIDLPSWLSPEEYITRQAYYESLWLWGFTRAYPKVLFEAGKSVEYHPQSMLVLNNIVKMYASKTANHPNPAVNDIAEQVIKWILIEGGYINDPNYKMRHKQVITHPQAELCLNHLTTVKEREKLQKLSDFVLTGQFKQ